MELQYMTVLLSLSILKFFPQIYGQDRPGKFCRPIHYNGLNLLMFCFLAVEAFVIIWRSCSNLRVISPINGHKNFGCETIYDFYGNSRIYRSHRLYNASNYFLLSIFVSLFNISKVTCFFVNRVYFFIKCIHLAKILMHYF